MAAHARNSPSDASRWMTCSGAINRCRKLGIDKSESGKAAAEGTAAHWVSEQCLRFGFDPYDFIGDVIDVGPFQIEVTDDMAEFLMPGIDRIRELPGTLYNELRINTTPWVGKTEDGEDQFGTLDRGIIGPDEWVIGDLKYGAGVPVECVGNKQIRIYALGFYDMFKHLGKPKRFRFIIDQPRNAKGGGEWVQTLDELLAFGEEVKVAAAKTFDPDAPCTPSEAGCRWCPAANIDGACPEFEAWNLDFLGLDFEDLDAEEEFGFGLETPDVEGLNVERRKAIYQHLGVLRKFLDRVESGVRADVMSGDGDKFGLKVVAGRKTRRKHRDEAVSEEYLVGKGFKRDQIVTIKLKTPSQLDKIVGKGKFPQNLIVGGEPTPSIVSIDDARPALPVGLEFENFEDDNSDFDD